MRKKISIGAAVFAVLLAILLTFQITYLFTARAFDNRLTEIQQNNGKLDKLRYIEELFSKYYIGEIDGDALAEYLMAFYVHGTGDRYARYFTAEEYAAYQQSMNSELVGIGVQIMYDDARKGIEILHIMPNSPASESGLQVGDLIVRVGEEDISVIGYEAAAEQLSGEAGSQATFTVLRGEEKIDFTLTRREIEEQSVIARHYGQDPSIGIVWITSFDAKTPAQFKAAVESLTADGVTRLVMDVRDNRGGNLDAIVEILDYLLPKGPIVRLFSKDESVEVIDSDDKALDMPMAVLVNGNTASAAELFSSALQDYHKGPIVGTQTYGKGTVLQIFPLSDGSAVSVSTQMYAPPFSDNFEGVGVTPDILVEMDASVADMSLFKVSDEEDTQLQAAIAALKEQ